MKPAFASTVVAVASLGFARSASIATASGFSGDWPVTLSHAQAGNGVYCLSLTDDGSEGWPHSGPATINTGLNGAKQSGIFEYIGHTILVSIDNPGVSQNAGTVYAVRASKGALGDGAFSEIYGGESINSGEVASGRNGGC
jgi:hypothetical protein